MKPHIRMVTTQCGSRTWRCAIPNCFGGFSTRSPVLAYHDWSDFIEPSRKGSASPIWKDERRPRRGYDRDAEVWMTLPNGLRWLRALPITQPGAGGIILTSCP